jgi:hypothetical protein
MVVKYGLKAYLVKEAHSILRYLKYNDETDLIFIC